METIIIKSRFFSYPIYVENGILSRLDEFLDVTRQVVVISDDGIPVSYVDTVVNKFPGCLKIIFPQGETSKSLQQYERIVGLLSANHVSRDALLVALGGGVTGDLAGFVAATYLRGIEYVQIPTSLLAQIDSSVGGKVAVNTKQAKNIVGCFYPPKMVLVDPSLLSTLPERQFRNGLGEMIKYGMVADSLLFEKLENPVLPSELNFLITRSINIKKRFVEQDEFDTGSRQALNFGHTFGHAIEAFYGYEKYLHGEAVAIGMMRIVSNATIKQRLENALRSQGLPTADEASNELLWDYVMKDKKNRAKVLTYIDVDAVGSYILKTAKSKEELL